jgi:MFS superfamily sulfate permease-like transporter
MKRLTQLLNKQSTRPDFLASVVVFLVALPLCMGIATASGVPPARGLVTGIIGGILVGAISGSPLQVSGPAAGLAIVIADLVREYGIEVLGAVVLVAGLIQALAGVLKLGQLFRAMSPAVIYGMLAGIGVLICASQLQVAIDAKPYVHGVENLMAIPQAIHQAIFSTDGRNHHLAALVSIITIAIMISWDRLKPSKLDFLPGALLGVIVASTIANLWQFPIQHVNISGNLAAAIALPQLQIFGDPKYAPLLLKALEIALIASAESRSTSPGSADEFRSRIDGPRLGEHHVWFRGGITNDWGDRPQLS